MSGRNGCGPCGACRFLRRKCVRGCVFAPYFDQDQGTVHFAAVHKVFGASNVSKLLIRIPAHKRLDAVVTLCYEALVRLRDPVHGCLAHIFTLQQQVVNLQAELASVQARLSTMDSPALPPAPSLPLPRQQKARSPASLRCCLSEAGSSSDLPSSCNNISSHNFDDAFQQQPQISTEVADFNTLSDQGDDLEAIAREFVSKYLPGVVKQSQLTL